MTPSTVQFNLSKVNGNPHDQLLVVHELNQFIETLLVHTDEDLEYQNEQVVLHAKYQDRIHHWPERSAVMLPESNMQTTRAAEEWW